MALPSHREPCALVYIEAALMKKPILACRAGGAPESIADGETGLLVPVRDSQAIAAALCELARQPRPRPRAWAKPATNVPATCSAGRASSARSKASTTACSTSAPAPVASRNVARRNGSAGPRNRQFFPRCSEVDTRAWARTWGLFQAAHNSNPVATIDRVGKFGKALKGGGRGWGCGLGTGELWTGREFWNLERAPTNTIHWSKKSRVLSHPARGNPVMNGVCR